MMTVVAATLAFNRGKRPAEDRLRAIAHEFGALARRPAAWNGRKRSFREYLFLAEPDRAEAFAEALMRHPQTIRVTPIEDARLRDRLLADRRVAERRAPGRVGGGPDRRRPVDPVAS